eukprot:Lankesteria_metandrocarpae@DN4682_c0_g1_i2.p1
MSVSLCVCLMVNRKSLTSVRVLSKDQIQTLMALARRCEQAVQEGRSLTTLASKCLGLLFLEPSTRTRCSFESAMKRLGGSVVSVLDPKTSSSKKGESFEDTVRMMSGYCDALAIRHDTEGGVSTAEATAKDITIINAGDGCGEHPTQALLDLYTIDDVFGLCLGREHPLRVTFLGDLKYGRTVHSLALLLARFNVTIKYISPDELRMPEMLRNEIEGIFSVNGFGSTDEVKRQINVATIEEALPQTDVLYVTRLQTERLEKPIDPQITQRYVLTKSVVDRFLPTSSMILHPLPRVNEMEVEVDETPQASYFKQARNGLYTRMAVLAYLLGDPQTI